MIKLFVDSGCNLSKELQEKYDISVLEAGIIFKDTSYASSVTWEYFTPAEFVSFLQEGNISKVFQPSIGDWEKQLREKITSPSDEIVYIATSSKISGSFRVFNILKNMLSNLPNKLHVIETPLGGPAVELAVLIAAKTINKDTTFEDLKNTISKVNKSVIVYDISESMKTWVATGRAVESKDLIFPSGIPLIKGTPDTTFFPLKFFSSFNDAIALLSKEMSSFKPTKCVFNYTYDTYPEWIDAFKETILKNNSKCEILADHISSPTSSAISGINSVNVAFI